MKKYRVLVVFSMILNMYAAMFIDNQKARKTEVKALVRAAIIAEAKRRRENFNNEVKVQSSTQSLQ